MTTAATASLEPLDSRRWALSRSGWVGLGIVAILFVVVHGVYLERLFRIVTRGQGSNLIELFFSGLASSWDPNWSHALVVPFISLYFIHQHRDRLAVTPARTCLWGLPIVFLGLTSYAFWINPGKNDMMQGYSMILTLFGLVLLLLGPAMMRVLWFPVLYLALAVKIADRLWEALAMKLQLIAAAGSSIALNIIGVFIGLEADLAGSTITLIHNGTPLEPPLDVAQACAGLRMLMAFIALGVAMAFLFDRPWWQRLAMILMTIPIAVGVNIGRVTALGLLHLVDPKYATGDFHTFIGLLMLIPAAGAFVLLGWILDRIIIRDEPEREGSPKAVEPATPAPAPAPPITTREGGGLAIAAGVGAVAAIVAAVIYYLMLGTRSPAEMLRESTSGGGSGMLLVSMLIKLLWVGVPVALVGGLIGAVTVRALRGWAPRLPRIVPGGAATGFVAGLLLSVFVMHQVVAARVGWVPIKEAVPLQRPLMLIPDRMGTWELVHEDPPLSADILQELGTQQYITRVYEDTSWSNPVGRYVRLHVPYYTGTADTVPHVPDRCFIGGGLIGLDKGLANLTLTGDGYRPDEEHGGYVHAVKPTTGQYQISEARVPATEFQATYFTFGAPNGAASHNVLYFFAANGKLRPTPDDVRFDGFDPSDKYSYYAKIEVQFHGVADKGLAAERASAFLSVALPEILACLPDWVEVTEGRYPAPAGSVPPAPASVPAPTP